MNTWSYTQKHRVVDGSEHRFCYMGLNILLFRVLISCKENYLRNHNSFVLQVYGERYVDQMGVIGYFSSNYVNETQIFMKKTIEMATTVSMLLLNNSNMRSSFRLYY